MLIRLVPQVTKYITVYKQFRIRFTVNTQLDAASVYVCWHCNKPTVKMCTVQF